MSFGLSVGLTTNLMEVMMREQRDRLRVSEDRRPSVRFALIIGALFISIGMGGLSSCRNAQDATELALI